MKPGSYEAQSPVLSAAGKLIGLLLFVAILVLPQPAGLPPEAQRLAAVTALMAALWLSQAIPIAATSLIPLVAFPLLGIQSAAVVSKSYINENIFLFLGGFIIALGIEKWGLHRRMALHIVRLLGTSLKRVVLGFMLATAFLSMWISNTASTLLMLPIGLAMIGSLRELSSDEKTAEESMSRFSVVLMLGIAYSASIGGLTTLVGTPTNVAFVGIWKQEFPQAPELSAGQWMTAVFPLGLLFLLCAWGILVRKLPSIPGAETIERSFFTKKIRALGPPTRAEKLMLAVFFTTAVLWVFRKPLEFGSVTFPINWGSWVERFLLWMEVEPQLAAGAVHDSTVAMGMALLMFFIPAAKDDKNRTQYLMDWKTAERLPWGILLLIGGGFALANAFSATGLSEWIGLMFAEGVEGWPIWLLVAAVCFLLTFMTELTSNVATISALLPILAQVAVKLEIDPRLVMIPAAISTSCAFMLPIATPPNAIVFGSGKIQMGQMVRYGIALNLLGVLLITLATFVLFVPQFDISLDALPEWAEAATISK
ncbi:MAG: SLC13/DASS family transporter [Planctomycetes bacterium]|nr:SLC13/DASS family transporter [Planctomycetota bacterium]